VTELEAEIARLRAQPQGADPAPFTAEINRQQWQIRYLEARVAYLEGQIRAVPAPVVAPEPAEEDREAKARADWRMRYLEARVAHLQGQPKADPAPMQARVAELEAALAAVRSDAQARIARAIELEAALRDAQSQLQAVPALRQRIGELTSALEAARAQPVETEEMRRARWRARYLASRVRHLEELRVRAPAAPQPRAAAQPVSTPVMEEPPLVPPGGEVRPEALPAPRAGVPDDLRLIDGVGPKIESTLNSLGVYHFDQIGAWTPANIAWVDQYLRFRGRIVREQWVEQARRLAANGGVGARALADELG
jgi:predicted flap endonuclease-1-like 5' DNA nuclease